MKSGIEGSLFIYSNDNPRTRKYNFIIILNYKTNLVSLTKFYRIHLSSVSQLIDLNMLTISYEPKVPLQHSNNSTTNMRLNVEWLDVRVDELSEDESKRFMHRFTNRFEMEQYLTKTSLPMIWPNVTTKKSQSTTGVGIIGDHLKESYFNVKHFELRNSGRPERNELVYNFYSNNPFVYEFNSLKNLFDPTKLSIVGSPQLIDTKYGKSLLFSKKDQQVCVLFSLIQL
jgi:hypothetical protein